MTSKVGIVERNNMATDSADLLQLPQSENAVVCLKQLKTDKILESKLTDPEFEVQLTKREREILDHILAGKTNKEIAQKLYRTERTVEYHRNRIMRKFGTHNTVELVKRAIAMGIA